MTSNTLDSYNFLATLTEQGRDLFKTVYIPICKRTLSFYSKSRKEFGSDTDIQDLFLELYGLNVPLTVVRQLLRGVESSMSRQEKAKSALQIYDNGKNFRITLFEFDKYEKTYQLVQKETELLQEAFLNYAQIHPEYTEESELLKFSDFLDKNKSRLAHFFSGERLNGESSSHSFLIHAQFLEHVRFNNQKLFEVSEKLYFGSIVASYLEAKIDFDAKFQEGEEYFIDTQIVLRALDIQDEFETQPAKELINLIKDSGAVPKVLGITISEIDYAYQVAIENYDKTNPTTTINQACLRKAKTKSWLISEQQQLEKRITDLGIKIDGIPRDKVEKYKKSKDIKLLQGKRKKRANAEHDVLAYLHIRELRSNMVRTYQKAKYWFVSSNVHLYHFNIDTLPQGVVSEVITPDSLTSLLWLKGNSSLDSAIRKVGLNELIIQTIHEEIANKELINELHETVKLNEEISEKDYQVLLESVAHQSAKRLNKLIDLAEENRQKYNAEIHQIIAKERERKKKILKETHIAAKNIEDLEYSKGTLNSKLNSIEVLLKDTSEKSQKEIESLKVELTNQKSAITKFKRSAIILLVSIVLLLVAIVAIESWNYLKITIAGITGLGGLWGFISLLINLYKLTKE